MTKFCCRNGLADQGYEDVLETICMMNGHAQDMQRHTGAAGLISARQRFHLSIEGNGSFQESLFTQKLLPVDLKSVHQPMTATAVWKKAQATSSGEFLAQFQTRFVAKNSLLPKRTSSGFSSHEENERKSMESLVLAASKPAELADSRNIFEIAKQQFQEETPRLTSQPTDQKQVVTILDWLSSINHQEMHNFNASERYHKTGVWISKDTEFQNWRDTCQSSVFWLHGDGEIFFNEPFSIRELTCFQREVENRFFRTLYLV